MGEGARDGLEFGRLIAQLRKDRGLSQTGLGEVVGITRQAVVDWEKKPFIHPKAVHVKRAARALGVPVGRLLATLESDHGGDTGMLVPKKLYRLMVDDYMQSPLGESVRKSVAEKLYDAQTGAAARRFIHLIRQELEAKQGKRRG
jgi:transcriptional regulator with XRE-family HTH domain